MPKIRKQPAREIASLCESKRSTKKTGSAAEEEIYFGAGKGRRLAVVLVASNADSKGVVAIFKEDAGEDGDELIHDLQERFPKGRIWRAATVRARSWWSMWSILSRSRLAVSIYRST